MPFVLCACGRWVVRVRAGARACLRVPACLRAQGRRETNPRVGNLKSTKPQSWRRCAKPHPSAWRARRGGRRLLEGVAQPAKLGLLHGELPVLGRASAGGPQTRRLHRTRCQHTLASLAGVPHRFCGSRDSGTASGFMLDAWGGQPTGVVAHGGRENGPEVRSGGRPIRGHRSWTKLGHGERINEILLVRHLSGSACIHEGAQ